MGLIALLSALVIGAISATALSILPFVMVLTTVFVVGSGVAVVMSSSASCALGGAFALFASAQVGYALGLAAMARIGAKADRSRSSSAGPRGHFRPRK